MVQQEYHFDHLQEQAEFVEEETEGEPSRQSPSANHTGNDSTAPLIDACRKRPLSGDVEKECNIDHLNLHKRGKTGDGGKMMQSLDCEPEEHDWVLPQEEEWSPPSASNPTGACVDVNSKLPMRRLADIEGDFMPITSPSGDRVYAKVKEIQRMTGSLQSVRGASRRSNHGLLSEPFEVLLEQVEQEALKQACRITEEQDSSENFITDSATHEQLWVEKYAPKSFTELLSDEQTNREVLRWLKQWDKCVFGGKKTSTSFDVFAALRRHTPTYQNRRLPDSGSVAIKGDVAGSENDSKGGNRTEQNSNPSSNPPNSITSFKNQLGKAESNLDRPDEKILLLCGPPGLGKTTLAHVAAKHCGYRVVEINASDDRVATTLQAKILDAVQMKSVMGDLRPNCVVIDEIDGALGGADGKGAIDALLKIAYAGMKESPGKENEIDGGQVKKGSKKKTSTPSRLSRPVICICNDPYAPALRQLRQMAKVHVFAQPSANRVVTRLKYICNLEGYKINARALTALAEHTECDIRSCLNTLQFLKRKKEPLNMLDIASQVVGRKDMTSSAFDIWGEVLQKRKSKHGIISRTSMASSESCGQEHKDFLRLHELLANHGDFELTNDGVYDNLLHIRYQDSSLQKMVECLELLGDSEITSHHALRHQHFTLNVYQPSFTLAIRRLIAQPEKPHIEWPKTFQRFRVEHGAKQELLRSWMMSMQPSTYQNFTARCLAWDLISPLLYILSPQKLRPVAPQLLSQSEKEEMSHLVDTMIGYGINYKISKKGTSSSNSFMESDGPVFEPPIHKLVQFKEYKSEHRLLSLTLRQVLSHEVELETIRRDSAARTARAMAIASDLEGLSLSKEILEKKDDRLHTKSVGVKIATAAAAPHTTSTGESGDKCAAETNVAEKPNAKASRKPAINFFAQFRRTSGTNGNAEKDPKVNNGLAQRDSRPLFFKFNEGFTNAIRRPMLIRELI